MEFRTSVFVITIAPEQNISDKKDEVHKNCIFLSQDWRWSKYSFGFSAVQVLRSCLYGRLPRVLWFSTSIEGRGQGVIMPSPRLSPELVAWENSWWRNTIQIWVLFLICRKFASTNQKHKPDLGSDASSVWNFYVPFSDVILQRNL